MPTDLTKPEPSNVLELLAAFRKSKTMFAAVELGIFDLLKTESLSSSDVATKLSLDISSTERLLNALVGLQLLENVDSRYINSEEATTYLTSDSPHRFTGYIRYSNQVAWKIWGDLEGAIREGTHRWKSVFGWDGPIFSSFFKTDESLREFLMGMHGFGVLSSPVVVNSFDLSRFNKMVDLGAATGHLVVAACQRYKNLTGVAFDLPEATPLAKELISQTDVADRVTVQSGDFFKDPLPPADLYALGRILHDWSQDKIEVLLAKIVSALPPGGGLLIAEKLLLPDGTGPSWAQMQDLNMLVCTEGRERTLAGYESLLLKAGFKEVVGVRTQVPIDAILATK